jgi:hypothetical protein
MTLEIAIVVTALAFVGALGLTTLLLLRKLVATVVAAASEPAVAPELHGYAEPMMPDFADPQLAGWLHAGEERVDDDDTGGTLLPFSTPLPAFPMRQTVEYSEDEDDLPTTLYRTDDDGEIAVLADLDD